MVFFYIFCAFASTVGGAVVIYSLVGIFKEARAIVELRRTPKWRLANKRDTMSEANKRAISKSVQEGLKLLPTPCR